MKYVTRFNPTANGPLHLGHVYIAMLNQHMAHTSGGKFIVRIDDISIDTLYSMTVEQMNRYADEQLEALDWLGIQADEVIREKDMHQDVYHFVAHNGWYIPEYKWKFSLAINPALYNDFISQEDEWYPYTAAEASEWYPYSDYLTYLKVIRDELNGVTTLIRGDDLRGEFSLYQHFRKKFGLPEIVHFYMPRMYRNDLGIVSKFHKAVPVLRYIENGWKPDDILELLAKSALRDIDKGWDIYNVKREPRLDPAFNITV